MKSYETVLKNNFFIFNLLDLLLVLHVLMYVYVSYAYLELLFMMIKVV